MSSYADKLELFVNISCAGLAWTLSKDVGILQVLLDARTSLTSDQIADRAGVKERYVRELLGSLASAEVIHVSTSESGCLLYYLEEDEKILFSGPLKTRISFPVAMIKVYDDLKCCLSKNGPQDIGIDVIEVGCGRGRMLAKIAQMFPKSSFTASDNVQSLQNWQKTNLSHIPNVEYDMLDLCCPSGLPSKQYDWVYCVNVIHDVPDPLEALKTVRKLTKPGGVFTIIDFATSGSPVGDRGNLFVACMYTISAFMSVPESFQREDSQAMAKL